jgi:hypothetical protein
VIVVAMYAEPVQAAANITFTVPNKVVTSPSPVTPQPPAQLVSRLSSLPGGSSEWALLTVSLLLGCALATFIIRHGLKLHRYLRRGEKFFSHHPYLDTLVVVIIVAGILLTRTSGVIR